MIIISNIFNIQVILPNFKEKLNAHEIANIIPNDLTIPYISGKGKYSS